MSRTPLDAATEITTTLLSTLNADRSAYWMTKPEIVADFFATVYQRVKDEVGPPPKGTVETIKPGRKI